MVYVTPKGARSATFGGLTSVDGRKGQGGQTGALHLLLLEPPLGLQDRVLELGPSVYVAGREEAADVSGIPQTK